MSTRPRSPLPDYALPLLLTLNMIVWIVAAPRIGGVLAWIAAIGSTAACVLHIVALASRAARR